MNGDGDDMIFGDVSGRAPEHRRRPERDRRCALVAIDEPADSDLPVYLSRRAAEAVERHAARDLGVELGGVLLGKECVDDDGRPFVWIEEALEAKYYMNTQASFTYTHDTWSEITRERERLHPGLEIVGWYHTHPDFGIFLSNHDLFIHEHFFPGPLQVAYVVDPVRRTRGFFQRRGGMLDPTAGFYLVAPRVERVALARLAEELESRSAAEVRARAEADLLELVARSGLELRPPTRPAPPPPPPPRPFGRGRDLALGAIAATFLVALVLWIGAIDLRQRAQTQASARIEARLEQTPSLVLETRLDQTLDEPRDNLAPQPATATAPAPAAIDEAPVPVPEPSEKALSMYRGGRWIWLTNIALGIVIPSVFLFSGVSARLRTFARRLGRNWFGTVAVYLVLFTLLSFVIELPWDYYIGFVRQHAYGLSNQTHAKWIADKLKGLGVGTVTLVLVGWIPYLLLRRSPRRWWLYSWLAAFPVMLFGMYIQPTVVAPLFNKFGAMHDKQLEARILALAERAGIDGGRVYEVSKSEDTNAVNAYVTGLGSSHRIVLWDTLLKKLSADEVLVVMGHEMGHYVLGHVISTLFLGWFLLLAGLFLADRLGRRLIARFQGRFGFDSLADVASVPLLMLVFAVAELVIMPAPLLFSRYHEHEADRFALELTHANHAGATAFVKLAEENLSVPRPDLWYVFFRSTHPPLGDRIDFCNVYHPWRTGRKRHYEPLFRH